MKWFKHETSALSDAKIEKLLMKFGLEGYGFYFACLELIAANLSSDNVTLVLEHDEEVLAHKFNKKPEKIKEMLQYLAEVGLFQYDPENNNFLCIQLVKRLDNTFIQNPEMKKITANGDFKKLKETLRNFKLGTTLPKSRIEENRIEENRIDNTQSATAPHFRDKTNNTRWNRHKSQITTVINHYNKLRGKKLIPHTENYVKLIGSLIEDGYTQEQCIAVINHQWDEWREEYKMRKFHRPETLFAYSNFQKYLPDALEELENKAQKERERVARSVSKDANINPELNKMKISELRKSMEDSISKEPP